MRHRVKKATLNKPADQRKAMIRNQLDSLFLYGYIKTTEAKAKATASAAEKLITLVNRQSEEFNSIRELKKVLFTEESQKKALEYAKATDKKSGFTRITKIKMRKGDGALIVQLDLITTSDEA